MQVRKHLAYCYNPSICCGRWSKTAMTMKLQQLRYLCGIAREGFSMSRAASALGTSQPAISKQISLLESELGVDLLIRKSNRILGLTAAGEAIIAAARRTLWEAENLERMTAEFTKKGSGRLVIATTHMY